MYSVLFAGFEYNVFFFFFFFSAFVIFDLFSSSLSTSSIFFYIVFYIFDFSSSSPSAPSYSSSSSSFFFFLSYFPFPSSASFSSPHLFSLSLFLFFTRPRRALRTFHKEDPRSWHPSSSLYVGHHERRDFNSDEINLFIQFSVFLYSKYVDHILIVCIKR